MMLSMLVNSLYNIVDSYFVAQISEQAMTALSLVYPLQLLETAIAVGFGIGMNAAAAYYLGAKEQQRADDIVTSGLILSLLHGVILMAATLLFAPAFVSLFTENEKILADGCVANIILDPLLIFGIGIFPKMGIEGAAIATGIGQVIPLIVYLFVFIKYPVSLHFHWHKKNFQKRLVAQMYGVGIPATLNLALPSFMITALNGILAVYSASYVLVLGIYYKLQTFIYLSANGIVQGIRPIISYNYGAGERGRVKRIFITALIMIASIMFVGMLICLEFAGNLIGLFTKNSLTILDGAQAVRIICMGFVISAVSVTISGMLEALGRGVESLILSLLRYVVVIIPAAFVLGKLFGGAAVWHCFWIAETIASLTAVFLIYRRSPFTQTCR